MITVEQLKYIDLPSLLRMFAEANPETATTDKEREAATNKYCNDEINVDEEALASRDGEGGLWVQAWVWVSAELLEEEA